MSKKFTTKFVRESFSKEGYVLSSDWEYVDNKTKIPYVCPKGHEYQISWSNWNNGGSRCLFCNSWNSETVRASFAKEGYVLSTDWEYVNCNTKIPYVCPRGHEYQISWSNWNNGGTRCVYCNNRVPVNTERVRAEFTKEGYKIDDDWEYVNNTIKIPYECSNGHRHSTAWQCWNSGTRCIYCLKISSAKEIRAAFLKEGYQIDDDWEYVHNAIKIPYVCSKGHNNSVTWNAWKSRDRRCYYCSKNINSEQVRESFAKVGYKIPEGWKYIDTMTKIPYECSRGHKLSVNIHNWLKRSQKRKELSCKHCNLINNTELVRSSFIEEGYKIPEDWEFVTHNTNIPYECPKGHKHGISWYSWNTKDRRCYSCAFKRPSSYDVRELFTEEGYIIAEDWEYVSGNTKIQYECPKGHNHNITFHSWQSGSRCVWCGRARANLTRYNPNENLTLYWIKIYDWIHGKWCYKFGISNNIKVRFSQDLKSERFRIRHIRQTTATASDICILEQTLLCSVKDYRAEWVPSYFGGNTECFECDEEEALRIWNSVVNGW